jgi:hypothetical protein
MPRVLCRPDCFKLIILHSSQKHVTGKSKPFFHKVDVRDLLLHLMKRLKENLRYPVLMGLKVSQNHAYYLGFLSVLHRTHSPVDKIDGKIANPTRIFLLKGAWGRDFFLHFFFN